MNRRKQAYQSRNLALLKEEKQRQILTKGDHEEDEVENEPVRLSQANAIKTKVDQRPTSAYHRSVNENKTSIDGEHSSTRQQQHASTRSVNVSFMSDVSKTGKTMGESTSSNQLKQLLDQLSSNMSELELVTGFKPPRDDTTVAQSNTCSTALVSALISLTGHVKQCAVMSKNKSGSDSYTSSTGSFRQEMTAFKEQLAIVAKAQLDFQQKMENQMTMLQTMMQTVCQLVNNEMATKSRSYGGHQQFYNTNDTSSMQHLHSSRQQQTPSFDPSEPRETTQNWMSTKINMNNTNTNNRQTTMVPKRDMDKRQTTNSSVEPVSYSNMIMQQIDSGLYQNYVPNDRIHHNTSALLSNRSTYMEALDASKKLARPTSATSTDIITKQTYAVTTNNNRRKNDEQDLNSHIRTTTISPDMPTSYDIFESGLPNQQQTARYPQSTTNETILEKILQERLLLVQQIAELNKQHELTQEELANLEVTTSNNNNNNNN
ncbi:unnamed protein product [Didymodactylos carnosus]|uniref:Uncharacterized protein n=1 Tax=Didymodactylos carnosus TaxID=1234261 RepID=A0A814BQD5_9BILA|nr:unnamed protein product [Didymodactylos carnosus]CAF0931379.1 unnamed protein product [Didymodactylos carnosus]CAF3552183.1 unnamed protein product [Didymodactylos carnosus]CAF3709283.1 unnamed protein product [Didymodactylos carnosus]